MCLPSLKWNRNEHRGMRALISYRGMHREVESQSRSRALRLAPLKTARESEVFPPTNHADTYGRYDRSAMAPRQTRRLMVVGETARIRDTHDNRGKPALPLLKCCPDLERLAGCSWCGGLLVVRGRCNFENGKERFLGNIHLADALHAALAFFLFFEEFAFAGNVAAVALGEHVFADGRDSFACNDAAANRGLDRHFKHLPWNELAQARYQIAPALRRKVAMDDQRQRIHGFAGDQHIQLDEVGFPVVGKMIVERSVAA